MIVETRINIDSCGMVTETLIDILGNSISTIVKGKDTFYDSNQSIARAFRNKKQVKVLEYTNCTIDFEGVKSLQEATKDLTTSILTDVSNGIHPIQKERKMIMTNPCREISLIDVSLMMNMNHKEEDNTNWEFHSSSDEDINWKDIKDSLSYAEPLALVTRKYRDYTDGDTYVVINKQLWDKAHTIGMFETSPSIDAKVAKRVFCISNNFSEWVAWAKDVKAASWEVPIKSTLSVILPTV